MSSYRGRPSNFSNWRDSAAVPVASDPSTKPSYPIIRGRPLNFSNWRDRAAVPVASDPSPEHPDDRNIMDGLLPVPSQRLKVPVNSTLPDGSVKIENLQYIASYNWIKGPGDQPTIIVPGSPPEWQNIAPPYTVTADTGKSFVDQNGHWLPSATLAPLVVAVNTQQAETGNPSNFDWSSVDLVTDRNGLRKLLRWITGPTEERESMRTIKDFRIDMQLAGEKTMLFNRWEKRTEEECSGFTFGYNFEKKTTVPANDCEKSTGHHRIIQYDLNGFKIVVRFEVDACLPPTDPVVDRNESFDVDQLASTLATTSISSPQRPQSTKFTSIPVGATRILQVAKGGSVTPQSSLIELTTRSQRRLADLRWEESFPQLFLSQTPYHYLGVHQSGRFVEVQKRDLGKDPELLKAEKMSEMNLKKLRVALELIREIVVDAGEEGRLSLVCRDGKLEVYERRSDTGCLPETFIRQFRART
ncbi:hypothetical protein BT96DRAFT_823934 [Gymnopus androsaceus JB14]|uniref:Geranylgeranyl pyrophosphate synthetase n=1 Tax=Gymnopus androsaceus JB14 TaxID=1447944 RepID=A0A6A4HIM5_9AGAR|nr:hypothetical protein BT96DRAFT_823934 [Gymnopus androsaceus JB14]